jgi:hypothetical protein
MATENPLWGEERIGNELLLKLGLTVPKSPPHSPKANAICERVIGTIRRECLDWLIPLSELHLRSILRSWVGHHIHGRPHMALGPGVPDPPSDRRAPRRDRVIAEYRASSPRDPSLRSVYILASHMEGWRMDLLLGQLLGLWLAIVGIAIVFGVLYTIGSSLSHWKRHRNRADQRGRAG